MRKRKVVHPYVRIMTDLLHDSLLFTFVCYRLCVLNYKYRVVAVVGP